MTHDLLLLKRTFKTKRRRVPDWDNWDPHESLTPYRVKTYKTASRETVGHLYLCDKHWPELYDFMEAYEGEEK